MPDKTRSKPTIGCNDGGAFMDLHIKGNMIRIGRILKFLSRKVSLCIYPILWQAETSTIATAPEVSSTYTSPDHSLYGQGRNSNI